MKKINLKTEEVSTRKKKERSGLTGLVLGMAILSLGLVIYGVIYYFNYTVKNERTSVESSIDEARKELDSEDFKTLYDFQDRLFAIEKLIDGKPDYYEKIEQISLHTLPETYFKNLKTEIADGKLVFEAVIVNKDYDVLASQLEAYSLIEGVDNLILNRSSQEEFGLESAISFGIKDESSITMDDSLN